MTKEQQLQSKCVVEFSHKYPERRGCLFSVPNRTLNARDGQIQLATGLVKGVSDLLYFYKGRFVAIEMKLSGAKHKRKHIEEQLKWLQTMEENNFEAYICTSLEGFFKIIDNNVNDGDSGIYSTLEVEMTLNNQKSQIIFY